MFNLQAYLSTAFSVTDAEWNIIARHLEEAHFSKNEYFITEGKVCRRSAFLLDGVMRYYSNDIRGDNPTCYFSFEGHYVVDPFTFKDQKPSVLNLVSVTECKLAVISFEQDKKLREALPKWSEITSTILLQIGMEFADQKTMMNLSAAERYAYFNNKYPQLALRVPLQYIASYLGIAQPSLSRLRKNLTKQK